jgi:hypothetical protein
VLAVPASGFARARGRGGYVLRMIAPPPQSADPLAVPLAKVREAGLAAIAAIGLGLVSSVPMLVSDAWITRGTAANPLLPSAAGVWMVLVGGAISGSLAALTPRFSCSLAALTLLATIYTSGQLASRSSEDPGLASLAQAWMLQALIPLVAVYGITSCTCRLLLRWVLLLRRAQRTAS